MGGQLTPIQESTQLTQSNNSLELTSYSAATEDQNGAITVRNAQRA